MTQAEVKALFPDRRPTPNHCGSPLLTIDSGYANGRARPTAGCRSSSAGDDGLELTPRRAQVQRESLRV